MKSDASRRSFLATGLAVPAAALGSASQKLPTNPRQETTTKLASTPKLEHRTLGKTGLKVTSVGFGCMITSDPSVIVRAADLGINYFDTARVYQNGNCERMVGAALKPVRKNIILSSKSVSRTKDSALADLDTSLKELQTDYLDIWYLHAKSKPEEATEELLEAQRIAKKAGKIRFAGISTHGGHKELIPAVAAMPHFDVILTTYNFTMPSFMDELVATAAKANLGVVAMKVMAGGQKPLRMTPTDDKTKEILRREGAMLAAIKWTLRNKNVHTTVPSTTDVEQLEENIRAMASPFGAADEKLLSAQLQAIGPHYCRMCGDCEGTCAQGLPVAEVLRYLMYAENYGEFALGREHFQTLPSELASVKCNLCPECTVQCPFGVRVAQRVSRAQEYFA